MRLAHVMSEDRNKGCRPPAGGRHPCQLVRYLSVRLHGGVLAAMDMTKMTGYAVSRRLQWSDSVENPTRPAALNTASTASTTLMVPAMATGSWDALNDAYFGRIDSASCKMSFSWEINARPQVMLR